MEITATIQFLNKSDEVILTHLRDNVDYLETIYTKHKTYCINFMRKMINYEDKDDLLEDIYQDAVIVLYEKVLEGKFELTSTIQTYLNSVCRNQILRRNNLSKKETPIDYYLSDSENESGSYKYNEIITDWLSTENDINNERVKAIVRSLELMKEAKGNCYEILTSFYYHKKSMQQIAEYFGYTNADNAKNQKARCQEKLKTLTYNTLKITK